MVTYIYKDIIFILSMDDLIITKNNEIVKYRVSKKVVKSGSAGAVSLPKLLVDKHVIIEYTKEEEK